MTVFCNLPVDNVMDSLALWNS